MQQDRAGDGGRGENRSACGRWKNARISRMPAKEASVRTMIGFGMGYVSKAQGPGMT